MAETFNEGDRVRLIKPRSYWQVPPGLNSTPVLRASRTPRIGSEGTVVRTREWPLDNTVVNFDGDDAVNMLVCTDCLWKVEQDDDAGPKRGVQRSHLLGEDGTTVLGLDDAKPGVYQAPTPEQDNHPTPLPPSMLEVKIPASTDHEHDREVALEGLEASASLAGIHQERADKAVRELAEFKEKVAEVARRYATEYDWCGTVEDALSELGIAQKNKVRFSLTLDLTVEAQLVDPGRWELVRDEWLSDSFHSDRLEKGIAQAMDSDWTVLKVGLNESNVIWDQSDGWIK